MDSYLLHVFPVKLSISLDYIWLRKPTNEQLLTFYNLVTLWLMDNCSSSSSGDNMRMNKAIMTIKCREHLLMFFSSKKHTTASLEFQVLHPIWSSSKVQFWFQSESQGHVQMLVPQLGRIYLRGCKIFGK